MNYKQCEDNKNGYRDPLETASISEVLAYSPNRNIN